MMKRMNIDLETPVYLDCVVQARYCIRAPGGQMPTVFTGVDLSDMTLLKAQAQYQWLKDEYEASIYSKFCVYPANGAARLLHLHRWGTTLPEAQRV